MRCQLHTGIYFVVHGSAINEYFAIEIVVCIWELFTDMRSQFIHYVTSAFIRNQNALTLYISDISLLKHVEVKKIV